MSESRADFRQCHEFLGLFQVSVFLLNDFQGVALSALPPSFSGCDHPLDFLFSPRQWCKSQGLLTTHL